MADQAPATKKKGSCLSKLLIGVAGIALIVGILWWWHNRPIEPVVLSEQELQVVEQKVGALQEEEPAYEKGSKEILLTERELNGLLHEHTDWGEKVHFTLATDAIFARIETELDPDLPLVGGRTLKARARFFVSDDGTGPHFTLDDVTVWGVSLPNDWLGGLKGRDLIGETIGDGDHRGLPGIKTLKVERGRIRIELKD